MKINGAWRLIFEVFLWLLHACTHMCTHTCPLIHTQDSTVYWVIFPDCSIYFFSPNLVTSSISITHVALCSLYLWSLVSYTHLYWESLGAWEIHASLSGPQYLAQCLSRQVQTECGEGRWEICTVSEVGVSQSQAQQVESRHTEMLAVMDN